MVTELLQSIDQYTIAQLLAATPMLFVVWLIIREINGVVRGGGKNQMTTAFETIGKVAGNQQEWQNKMAEVGQAIATISNNQDGIINAVEKVTSVAEKLLTKITNNEKEDEQTRKDIAELKANSTAHQTELDQTNRAVSIMSTDVDKIKITLDEISQQLVTLSKRQENGERLSQKHQDTLELILEKLKVLEGQAETPTEKIPIEIKASDIAASGFIAETFPPIVLKSQVAEIDKKKSPNNIENKEGKTS